MSINAERETTLADKPAVAPVRGEDLVAISHHR